MHVILLQKGWATLSFFNFNLMNGDEVNKSHDYMYEIFSSRQHLNLWQMQLRAISTLMRRRTQIISFTSVAQLHNLIPAPSSENVTKMRSLTVNHPVKSSMHCFIPKPGFCQIVKEAIEPHFKSLRCML